MTISKSCRLPAAGLSLAIAAGLIMTGSPAFSEEGHYFGVVSDPVVKEECSACHMAFPAAMLPAKSWEAIANGLTDHFGENATLDHKTTAAVREWLTSNAAAPGRWMTNTAGGDTPMRITETAWWTRAHNGEVSPAAFEDPRVGSKANCAACHRGAEKGFFEDD
jgi:mono/diheme cytochrome c family protein